MLGDLALALSHDGRFECVVLSGSTVRAARTWNRLPRRLGSVRIQRVRTITAGKATFLHRIVEYSAFYIGVATRMLLLSNTDVVVSFTTPPLIALAAAFPLMLRRVPLVYYVQDLYPELLYDMGYVSNPWLIRRLTVANRIILRRANTVITIAQSMAQKLRRNYGARCSSVTVIPNWSTDIRYKDPLPGSARFLYTGNIGLAHDFSLLGPLVASLVAVRQIGYCFVGGGRQYASVRGIFDEQGERRVEFLPYVTREELPDVIAGSHFCMLAQKEETVGDILPSKYYGYLAAGRPVIYFGTRKSDIGHEVAANGLGFVVECDADVDRVSSGVLQLISDRSAHADLCHRVAEYSRDHYGLEESAHRVRSVLEKVAIGGSG